MNLDVMRRGSVAECWRLKPEVSCVRLPATAGFFTFLYFAHTQTHTHTQTTQTGQERVVGGGLSTAHT